MCELTSKCCLVIKKSTHFAGGKGAGRGEVNARHGTRGKQKRKKNRETCNVATSVMIYPLQLTAFAYGRNLLSVESFRPVAGRQEQTQRPRCPISPTIPSLTLLSFEPKLINIFAQKVHLLQWVRIRENNAGKSGASMSFQLGSN